jgi:hypothetical protein
MKAAATRGKAPRYLILNSDGYLQFMLSRSWLAPAKKGLAGSPLPSASARSGSDDEPGTPPSAASCKAPHLRSPMSMLVRIYPSRRIATKSVLRAMAADLSEWPASSFQTRERIALLGVFRLFNQPSGGE